MAHSFRSIASRMAAPHILNNHLVIELMGPGERRLTHFHQCFGVHGAYLPDPFSQRRNITGLDQEAIDAVLDDVGGAVGNVVSDGNTANAHCLNQYKALALQRAGQEGKGGAGKFLPRRRGVSGASQRVCPVPGRQ